MLFSSRRKRLVEFLDALKSGRENRDTTCSGISKRTSRRRAKVSKCTFKRARTQCQTLVRPILFKLDRRIPKRRTLVITFLSMQKRRVPRIKKYLFKQARTRLAEIINALKKRRQDRREPFSESPF
ncbi:hypothetical protein CHS0354_026666 [Potamilus streckersoni]|uniref:Uncharacterized protein n=1 Tax=Potamilus streckersoni TaxID=2493646 RepID=A0AAE0S7V8_9BIVA|nr:hypothetical protein CHS0354_026666 [Potamilus streckersoni]